MHARKTGDTELRVGSSYFAITNSCIRQSKVMVLIVPSWNTDQGVHLLCELKGLKAWRRSESNTCQPEAIL